MKLYPKSPLSLLCLVFTVITLFSCSKDSDLLADYVALDPEIGTIAKFVANDRYQISISNNPEDETFEIIVNTGSGGTDSGGSGGTDSGGSGGIDSGGSNGTTVNDSYQISTSLSIVLDVLANDTFNNLEEVSLIETSQPNSGSVLINSDNTLTFTPSTIEASEDTFTYTTEFVKEDGTVGMETGTVTVTINENPNKTITDMGALKAFPGAEGFGRHTRGGRGGRVIHVTNLNNSGPGSLRDAVESQTGKRIIVFDVSGYIDIATPLKIRNGHGQVTISGETAPFPGICIRGASIWIHEEEVIIRHLKIRPGRNAYSPSTLPSSSPDYEPDDAIRIVAYAGDFINNVILDHLSITWGNDENIGMGASSSGAVTNVTIQNCLIAENVNKGYGVLFDSNGTVDNLTVFRNMFVHHKERVPSFDTYNGDAEFVNNLVYSFSRGSWIMYGCKIDYVSNVYLTNPNISRVNETVRLVSGGKGNISNTSVYIKESTEDGSPVTTNIQLKPYITDTRINNTELPEISSSQVKAYVLANAGDILHSDIVDSRIKADVSDLTGGIISHEDNVGGYPTMEKNNHPAGYDTDNDGMADDWEISIFGDLSKTNNGDENGNGYTNLEEFLYFLTL